MFSGRVAEDLFNLDVFAVAARRDESNQLLSLIFVVALKPNNDQILVGVAINCISAAANENGQLCVVE